MLRTGWTPRSLARGGVPFGFASRGLRDLCRHEGAGLPPLAPPDGAGLALELEPIPKWDFYEAVATADHVLTIQTADQQRFANILLSVGVRMD